MANKVIIVTGANSGIGYEASKELLEQGAKVVFASRNKQKTEEVLKCLNNNNNAEYIHLDLSSIESIKSFVAEFKLKYSNLDILVNNAFNLTGDYSETPAGFENTVGTNYIGHLMLSAMLLPLFRPNGRVITMSSIAFDWVRCDKEYILRKLNVKKEDYDLWQQYSISKLGISSFAQHLAKYIEANNLPIKSVFLHPGFVNTPAFKKVDKWYVWLSYYLFYPFIWYFYKDQYIGAQTVLYLCYLPYEQLVNGAYYADCKLNPIPAEKKSDEVINTVMKYTCDLIYKQLSVDKIPQEVDYYLKQYI
jgi:retinol dehydrogenase-12